MTVKGTQYALHEQKKFLLDSMQDKSPITFGQYCQMFGKGDDPTTIDTDFNDYLIY